MKMYEMGHRDGHYQALAELGVLLEKNGVNVKAGQELECLERHLSMSRQHITEIKNERL